MVAISCSLNPPSQRVPCCQSLPPTCEATNSSNVLVRYLRHASSVLSRNQCRNASSKCWGISFVILTPSVIFPGLYLNALLRTTWPLPPDRVCELWPPYFLWPAKRATLDSCDTFFAGAARKTCIA